MVTQMMSRNWRDLIRPKAITLDPESNSESYGKFTCEPLERGFGITIGNSLRRVLLASLQGAAITAVRLETALQAAGVIHTDFERGFIRAEVIAYDDYIRYRGEAGAREAGRLRLEGKEYVVHEGDVMHFRFNV
jgi:hypothetical protein